MYFDDSYPVTIKIDLPVGKVHLFTKESSSGKSRLAKELLQHNIYGDPVASYTYNDKLRGISINDILVPNKYKVILLDRYDMYNGDGVELIKQCLDSTIIIIDCKGAYIAGLNTEYCTITMEARYIEVTE